MLNNSDSFLEPVPSEVTLDPTKTKKKTTKITKPAAPLEPVSSPGRILAQRRVAQAQGQEMNDKDAEELIKQARKMEEMQRKATAS